MVDRNQRDRQAGKIILFKSNYLKLAIVAPTVPVLGRLKHEDCHDF